MTRNVKTKCAIYLRVSLDATGEHLAVDRQREDCRRIAIERGWTVVDEYVDNSISASKKNVRRPAYDRMVRDFAARRFTALVCWDLDRLTRQPRQLEDWIEAAEEHGLVLVTANGEADLSTDGGRLFARIKASVARGEVERKSARQKRAAAQRAEHGKVPAGVRLTGYTVKGEIVEDEAQDVRAIFARFAAGDSLRGISRWLTEQGITTRRGKAWNPSTIRTILLNPRYAGRAIYCGKVTGAAGNWPALVDDATFDAVQDRINDPRRKTNRRGTDRKYLGSGLYLCGLCDHPVRSHTGNRYRCPEGHVNRLQPSVDDYVTAVVKARLALPDITGLLAKPNTAEAERLASEIRDLRARLASIESDYDTGLIDGRRYAVATEKVQAQLTAAETARARTIGGNGFSAIIAAPDPAAAFDSAPLGTRREVVGTLVTVRLFKTDRGRKFKPETVDIGWKRS